MLWALVGLLVLVICICQTRFARAWGLTLWYASAIALKGLGVSEDAEYRSIARTLMREWSEAVLRLFTINVEVEGRENIPPSDTPCLYLCNHQSSMDIPTLVNVIPSYFAFMPKMEIRSIPVVGYVLERSGHIFLDRSSPEKALVAMNQVAAPALRSRSFLIFPEG